MAQIAPMNGGDDSNSYVNNSTIQRDCLNAAKSAMKEALVETLDLPTLLRNGPALFTIADLGCSVGPNTLFAMETIVDTVQNMSHSRNTLEFQVLFNDITANDFNTLFASLPNIPTKYFSAGVPGSFYGRLFPSSSVHVAYTSSSLHWLSGPPADTRDPHGPAWNSGRVHYTGGAPEAVVRAYAARFEEDMGVFFGARSEEIVKGGVMVILMPGVPEGVVTHDVGIALAFLGSILMDMVNEGIMKQDLVDSFNFPHVYPSVEQMRSVVRKNGCFEIVKMELRNARPDPEAPIDMESAVLHVRAFTEGSLEIHFGREIVDRVFERAIQLKGKLAYMLHSSGIEIGAQLFALLKRK